MSFSRGASPPRDGTKSPVVPALQVDSFLLSRQGSPYKELSLTQTGLVFILGLREVTLNP